MYLVKEYLTGKTVAITSRKKDALAMIQVRTRADEPALIIEEPSC
jgi:hypothetical protein